MSDTNTTTPVSTSPSSAALSGAAVSTPIKVDPELEPQSTSFFTDPMNLSIFMVSLIFIVTMMIYLGGFSPSYGYAGNTMFRIVFASIIILLMIYVIIYMLYYYFGIDISASFEKMFQKDPELDININRNTTDSGGSPVPNPVPEPTPTAVDVSPVDNKEVFNISDNLYNFNDAKTLCKAYGASLATYDQIEESYRKGGEWCNYGWSDKQLALYPTQKDTYAKLQKIKGHEHDCGRPGINGGYISNPGVRFGVNCYGKKPQITDAEKQNMSDVTPYPKSNEDIAMEKKIAQWKKNLSNIMVNPFNKEKWSKYT